MKVIILALIVPFLCFVLAFAINLCLLKQKKAGTVTLRRKSVQITGLNQVLKLFLPIMILEMSLLLILCFLVKRFMFLDGDNIPISVVVIASVLPFAAAMTAVWTTKEKLSRFLKSVALSAMIILAAEVVVFNGKSFTTGSTDTVVDLQEATVEGEASLDGDHAVITRDGSVTITNVPKGTKALICDVRQAESDYNIRIHVWLRMTDDNFKTIYQTVQDKYTIAGERECTFSFRPYGEVRSLQLCFNEINQPVTLYSIRAVSALPFSFSMLRYFVLLAVLSAIAAIRIFGFYKTIYQKEKRSHRLMVVGMTVVCVLSSLLFLDTSQGLIEYTPGADYSANNDPYVQVFDAFNKGQVHLDIEPDPMLETLENVYDKGERDESGVNFMWDFAYYNGHYYSYFGVAPLLMLYYPFYWITGSLPSWSISNVFFSSLAILFMCLTILAVSQLLMKKRNLLMLLGCMAASTSCVGVYFAMNSADRYCLPLSSGLCFLFLCLYTGVSALIVQKKPLKYLLFIISGASLALCVASRPSLAVSAAVLLPFFIGVLLKKQGKLSFRLSQAICFAIPLCLGMVGIMWYNVARFDSPFDFGAAYQLTASDVHANKPYISAIPATLLHYFFQPLRARATFPFIDPPVFYYNNYGSHNYVADAVGAMTYPFILVGMLLIPLAIKRYEKNISGCGVTKLQYKSFFIVGIVAALFTAWQVFCMGGITQRYIVDIMPLMVLLSSMAILRCAEKPSLHIYRYILTIIAMVGTVFIGWLLLVELKDCRLVKNFPYLYEILEDLFVFWM